MSKKLCIQSEIRSSIDFKIKERPTKVFPFFELKPVIFKKTDDPEFFYYYFDDGWKLYNLREFTDELFLAILERPS